MCVDMQLSSAMQRSKSARAGEQVIRIIVAERRAGIRNTRKLKPCGGGFQSETIRRFQYIRENKPLRVLILALSVLGMIVGVHVAKASPSMTDRYMLASVDPAAFTSAATQETEDEIGLDRAKRRDVQRRLTGLGFRTKVNGRFDEKTRAVIARWQEAHGLPKTGFLNTLQHQALLHESVTTSRASLSSNNDAPRRSGGHAHHRRGGGGPGELIGGLVGGLFGRR